MSEPTGKRMLVWSSLDGEIVPGEDYPGGSDASLREFDSADEMSAWIDSLANDPEVETLVLIAAMAEYNPAKHYPGAGQMLGMMN